ncbi:S-layer homology domain-containing protein [Paenibacillus donghaensis]|uniref:SLH domain-containing protein n=1 Tax=Paenibacillus donghaensis TaxID=414771 RepID=A0A2Z2KR31_9BACL|nr:S-layer homology domain-containing protein [Paenibacillus donghaensis]ASA23852.1 hypothetical protein B9T62_25565 [Paenibacillus donghaensis]
MSRNTWSKKACVAALCAAVVVNGGIVPASANYTTGFVHEGVGQDHGEPVWKEGNRIAAEEVDFSQATVGDMMKAIESFDFDKFKQDNADLPWLDSLLVNEGIIPDDNMNDEAGANTLFSRGSALYMKTQDNSKLGFAGSVHYADTLNQDVMYTLSLSTGDLTEERSARKNYPSHENQTYRSGDLEINQRKFITNYNSAVTLLEFKNPTDRDVKLTLTVKSPFVSRAEGDELIGDRVAAPLMIGKSGQKVVEAMSYVDVHLSGTGLSAAGNQLVREITVPAGGMLEQKVVMGWLADEIPGSKTQYEEFKSAPGNNEAFTAQVQEYNKWWADNIPYIDVPDENVKKVLYYRWWCNRFNMLEANIPGNDWQFPMNMEGVLGYNNGITVSVPWALQDLKWLRDPSYAYGTWLAQGEYSENKNYKNNPGRPNIWTWDMMQNSSQVGWEAYKIYGGGKEILKKFADFSANDVNGTLAHFKGNDPNLVYYNHGPMTGNDGDTVSMHWNGNGNNARLDGSATTYGNAVATAQMYQQLGDTENAGRMNDTAGKIQHTILQDMWFDGKDFDSDGTADTNGEGSFLHKKVVGNKDVFNPWRDNNMFVFNFGVVPTEQEDGYQAKYLTQLTDYADPNYYPIFPFFTADQNSIMKRVEDFKNGKTDAFGTDQFAWCNFGNYINTVRASLRHYPVDNINSDTYKTLFDWGAWLHTVEPGNTDHLDSNEFFWLENYFFGTPWTPDNPPKPSGEMVRAWIHHDTLGMMNYTVVEDMAGIQPRTDSQIELWPINVDYDYFAVDNVRYHDADLSIVWQDPAKYSATPHYEGIPAGYSLFINGERVMTTNEMSHIIYNTETGKVELPEGDVAGAVGDNSNTEVWYQKDQATPLAGADDSSLAAHEKTVDMFNKAGVDIVHNGENFAAAAGTSVESTYVEPGSALGNLVDGSTIASIAHTSNTTLFGGSPNATDTVTFQFDGSKPVDNVKVYFYNNRLPDGYGTPQTFGVEYLDVDGITWKPVEGQFRYPEYVASNYNNVEFRKVHTAAIRVTVTHASELATGIKEIQIYDNALTVTPAANKAPKVSVDSPVKVEQNTPLTLVPAIHDDGLPGGRLTYHWEQLSGEGEVELDAADQAVLKATFTTMGDYVFRLTVSDGDKDTAVDVPISVFVATAELSELAAKFADRDSGKLIRNQEDFTEASWTGLQAALAVATALLNEGSYTPEEVKSATDQLRAAISSLRYRNAALLAVPSASYTSAWESVYGVNDGYIPYTSYSLGDSKLETQYGNWGGSGDSHWLQYTWSQPVSLSGSSLYFYDDGSGVQVPADYSLDYWDGTAGKFVPVTHLSDKGKVKGEFNAVTFDEVKTDKLRLTLVRQPGSWTGVKEWRALSAKPEGEIADPGSFGEIVSIEQISVNTTIGVVPTLPSKVLATYANGNKAMVEVQWEDISLNKLTIATDFVISGKLAGSDLPASCRIFVKYDKSRLKAMMDTAGDPGVNEDQYTASPEQWEALHAALTAARAVYENGAATEGDINAAYIALRTAFEALQPVEGHHALISGITIPGGVVDQAAKEIIVPETTTLEELNEGLTVAKGVTFAVYEADGLTFAKELRTGYKITASAAGPTAATTYTLTLFTVSPAVNWTRLEEKLEQARALEQKLYTEASWTALQKAVSAAVLLLESRTAEQAEVDAAQQRLEAAISGLKLLPTATPAPTVKPSPTPTLTATATPTPGNLWSGEGTPTSKPSASAAATAVVSQGSIVLQAAATESGGVRAVLRAADFDAAAKGITGGTLTVAVHAAAGAKEVAVELPLQSLLAAKEVRTLRVELGAASVLLNDSFLKAYADGKSSKLEIAVSPVDPASLPMQARALLGDNALSNFRLSVDGTVVPASVLKGKGIKLVLPYTLKSGENPHKVVAYHLEASRELEAVKSSKYNAAAGTLEFNLNHGGSYAAVYVNVSFRDTAAYAWATDSIEALAARGAIQGVAPDSFNPEGNVTRAEFITILMNTFEQAEPADASTFKDVQHGAWYAGPVASAQKLGIVKGKPDGNFGVKEEITREEMAVMLHRFALIEVSTDNTESKAAASTGVVSVAFTDQGQVSSYATKAVEYMGNSGVMSGMTDGSFAPEGQATRAQAATVIYRLLGHLQ